MTIDRRRAARAGCAAMCAALLVLVPGPAADGGPTALRAMMAGRAGWSTQALLTIGEGGFDYRVPGRLGAFVLDATTVRVPANHEVGSGD